MYRRPPFYRFLPAAVAAGLISLPATRFRIPCVTGGRANFELFLGAGRAFDELSPRTDALQSIVSSPRRWLRLDFLGVDTRLPPMRDWRAGVLFVFLPRRWLYI